MSPHNITHLKPRWNDGKDIEDRRNNQMVHFLRRLWGRFGVGISAEVVPDLVNDVKQDLAIRPERVRDVQPDGRVLIVTNLGRYGTFPIVYDPTTDMLVTVLTWAMLRYYDREKVKRKHEQRAAEAIVEDLP